MFGVSMFFLNRRRTLSAHPGSMELKPKGLQRVQFEERSIRCSELCVVLDTGYEEVKNEADD